MEFNEYVTGYTPIAANYSISLYEFNLSLTYINLDLYEFNLSLNTLDFPNDCLLTSSRNRVNAISEELQAIYSN